MSFLSFHPALNVPLGSCADVASRGVRALSFIVPASRAACPTVLDGRLQLLFVGPGGHTGADWWIKGWYDGAGTSASDGSASASADSFSMAATSGSLSFQGSDELGVHRD